MSSASVIQQRILTGIQSTGPPHLGNLLGAIQPAVALSNATSHLCYYFIADLHSLTSLKSAEQRHTYTQEIARVWLSCGLDAEKHLLYRQSRVPEVCELTWYLSCFTPYPMLSNAHAFKEKAQHLAQVSAGLFSYPVLMSADILLYQAHQVPVGKDQQQHLEMARDIAQHFHQHYGETFVLPQGLIQRETQLVLGTDGQKMSKSYRNVISPFAPEKELKKQIFSIQTDSTPLAKPKNPDTCTVFQLYKLLASDQETQELREKYEKGGYGYGDAKKELLSLMLKTFAKARERYDYWKQHPKVLEDILQEGEKRARVVARGTLQLVRSRLGFD